MIPKSANISINTVELVNEPSKTYKLDVDNKRIVGFTDELDAIKQAIYLILNVERYEYLIYSWNYGIETVDLYGRPFNYVIPELQRRIKDALVQDDRINDVRDFKFETTGNKITAYFTVITTFGEVTAEKVVNI